MKPQDEILYQVSNIIKWAVNIYELIVYVTFHFSNIIKDPFLFFILKVAVNEMVLVVTFLG